MSSCIQPRLVLLPGRRGVTLGKPDIKVETINKETHSLEEDSGSVSTASRMVKAMYSVSSSGRCVLGPDTVYTACSCREKTQINSVTSPYATLYLFTKKQTLCFPL